MNTLVLSGGSIKGISTLGSIKYLEDHNYLESIDTYIGTSIGSIIAYLLLIGYQSIDIFSYILDTEFLNEYKHLDFVSMIKNEGAFDFSVINNHLKRLTIDKIGTYITMGDIKNILKKRLVCCTYNYTKKRVEYLDSDKEEYASMSCLLALRLSSNIPVLFSKFKYNGDYYIDGGIADNYPCILPDKSIGIVIGYQEQDVLSKDVSSKDTSQDKESLLEYIYNICHIPIKRIYHLSPKPKINITLHIPTQMYNMFLTTKGKLEMFSQGYYQTQKALDYILFTRRD